MLADPSQARPFGMFPLEQRSGVDDAANASFRLPLTHPLRKLFQLRPDDVVIVPAPLRIAGDSSLARAHGGGRPGVIRERQHDQGPAASQNAVGMAIGVAPSRQVLHRSRIALLEPPQELVPIASLLGAAKPDAIKSQGHRPLTQLLGEAHRPFFACNGLRLQLA